MTKKWTNYAPGQRVEATDAIEVAVDSPVRSIQALVRDVIMGQGAPVQNAVISGFQVQAPGTPTTGTLTVSGGQAIVGFRRNGQTEFGMVLGGGSAQKSTDVTAVADGVYGVYVRFEFQEGFFANRFFWNPLALTPVETPANVATRLVEDWSLTVDVVSPGPEWVQVASFDLNAGVVSNVTDQRPFAFDTATGTVTDAEWGTIGDRLDPNGALREVVLGLERQVQDLLGDSSNTWRAAVPVGGALMSNGSKPVNGSLVPDATAAERNLGSASAAFNDVYAESLRLVSNNLPSAAQSPRLLRGVDDAVMGQAVLGPVNPILDAARATTLDVIGATTVEPLLRVRNQAGGAVSRIGIGNPSNAGENTTLIHTPNTHTAPGASTDAPTLEFEVGTAANPGLVLVPEISASDYRFRAPKRVDAHVVGMNYAFGSGTLTQAGRSVGIGASSSVTYDLSSVLPAGASIISVGPESLTGAAGVVAFDLRVNDGTRGTDLGAAWFNGGSAVIKPGNQSCTLRVDTSSSASNVFLSGLIIAYEISEVS